LRHYNRGEGPLLPLCLEIPCRLSLTLPIWLTTISPL
jgi:hypothetical protein